MKTDFFKLNRRISKIAWAFASMVLLLAPGSVHAEELSKLEKLKAAYLFNFTKYINWRDKQEHAAGKPILICVQDNPQFESFLAALALNRPVGSDRRNVEVSTYKTAEKCHITYVSSPNITLGPHLQNSLVVVSNKQIAHPFAAISYYLEDGKLRFEVDLERIEPLNMSLSSELLKLAKIK